MNFFWKFYYAYCLVFPFLISLSQCGNNESIQYREWKRKQLDF